MHCNNSLTYDVPRSLPSYDTPKGSDCNYTNTKHKVKNSSLRPNSALYETIKHPPPRSVTCPSLFDTPTPAVASPQPSTSVPSTSAHQESPPSIAEDIKLPRRRAKSESRVKKDKKEDKSTKSTDDFSRGRPMRKSVGAITRRLSRGRKKKKQKEEEQASIDISDGHHNVSFENSTYGQIILGEGAAISPSKIQTTV